MKLQIQKNVTALMELNLVREEASRPAGLDVRPVRSSFSEILTEEVDKPFQFQFKLTEEPFQLQFQFDLQRGM